MWNSYRGEGVKQKEVNYLNSQLRDSVAICPGSSATTVLPLGFD